MSRFSPVRALALAFVALALFATLGIAGDTAQARSERSNVIITFASPPNASDQAAVRGAGGDIKYTYTLVNAIAASLPAGAIEGLSNNPNITAIELDIAVQALDAELDNTWGVKRIGAGTVHDGTNTGGGIKIAVIDSGVDSTHPDLDANYSGGYDFVNNDANPMDDNGHGTHVAGTIAAEDDGSGVVGVAPGASIYALKVLNSNGSGSYSDVIAALQWAVDNKIQITNNSYGSSGDPGAAVKAAFDNSAAAGVLHIGAAGNSGNRGGKGDNVIYPARWDSVVAVAATKQDDSRASFSSTGNDVELAAPGVSINSTLLGGGYGTKSGTSMASPHVAGTAALIMASGISDAVDVRLLLQQTADDLGKNGRDEKYGFGLVDADEAAGAPANAIPMVSITSPVDGATFPSRTSISFAGTASDTEDGDLTSSLVWTSSIDGSIGTVGGSFSSTLSDGTHTITASVTDSGGASGFESVSITVGTPNANPTVSITSPADGATFPSGTSISFAGTASDTEDGDLTANIAWTSSDGSTGSGGSFSLTPSDGVHTITASVTDSDGVTSSASVNITVGDSPTTISIGPVEWWTEGGKNQDKHLYMRLTLWDDPVDGNLVSGATVSVELKNLDSAWVGTAAATTGDAGTVTFNLKNARSGNYVLTVTGVSHSTLTWDGTPPAGNTYLK